MLASYHYVSNKSAEFVTTMLTISNKTKQLRFQGIKINVQKSMACQMA